jgi:hypothetical protein
MKDVAQGLSQSSVRTTLYYMFIEDLEAGGGGGQYSFAVGQEKRKVYFFGKTTKKMQD